MTHRTALITGGTSGVGLSVAKALVKADYGVHIVGRDPEKGARAAAELSSQGATPATFHQVDLSDALEADAFAATFADTQPTLACLVLGAGALFPRREETVQGLEKTFAVTYLSAYLVAQRVAGALANTEGARLLTVSGAPRYIMRRRLDFNDLQSRRRYSPVGALAQAVHAKTVLTAILADQLENVSVNAFHPGGVRSDLPRRFRPPLRQMVTAVMRAMPAESACGAYVATSPEVDGVTGQLFVKNRPRPLGFDDAYKRQLQAATEAMVASMTS